MKGANKAADPVSPFADTLATVSSVSAGLAKDGWARRGADEMRRSLSADDSAWQQFADGWNAMPPDAYMADGGTYRRRLFGAYRVSGSSFAALSGEPHYQSREHNSLNGGVDRWFAPLSTAVACSAILRSLIEGGREIFSALAPITRVWRVEVHQFRIEARQHDAGMPTPEGRHRDGVTAGLVMLVARRGVVGGTTRLWTLGGGREASFTMTQAGEALYFDDRRILHDVTPVVTTGGHYSGYRDVLVITFSMAE